MWTTVENYKEHKLIPQPINADTNLGSTRAPRVDSRASRESFAQGNATDGASLAAREARALPFSEWKSIYVDYSGKLQRAQIDSGE